MKLEQSNLIVKRAYKEVYKCDEGIVKVFEKTHSKADVFNEALNTARVEEAGLDIPKVKSVTEIDGKWAVVIEYKDGKTLGEMMKTDPANIEKYMEDFVDLQLQMHSKIAPRWAHATQGNASADAAKTYLLFALDNQKTADLYLKLFCKKSDTARQYVEQWLPIVAAAQLTKNNEMEKDFLMKWIDVFDYQ